jgi:hypothetical protein
MEKTEATRKRTQELIEANSGDRDSLTRLRRNLEVQNIVLRAGDLYCKHLTGQLVKLAKAKAELQRQREVALNTYETISLASTMLSTIRKSMDELKAIQSMQVPDILPLQTERMRAEFQIISEQLRGVR